MSSVALLERKDIHVFAGSYIAIRSEGGAKQHRPGRLLKAAKGAQADSAPLRSDNQLGPWSLRSRSGGHAKFLLKSTAVSTREGLLMTYIAILSKTRCAREQI